MLMYEKCSTNHIQKNIEKHLRNLGLIDGDNNLLVGPEEFYQKQRTYLLGELNREYVDKGLKLSNNEFSKLNW